MTRGFGCSWSLLVGTEKHALTCGNAPRTSLDVVGDDRSPRDFLRTVCGLLLVIGPPRHRRLDPGRVAANGHDGEHVDPVGANEIHGYVREPLERHSTVGLEEDDPGLGEQFDALDLLIQPRFEPRQQRRVELLVVVIDRSKVVFHPWMKDDGPPSHALRAASRVFSSSQVSPIDGSA